VIDVKAIDDDEEATTMLNGSAVSGAESPRIPPTVQRSCGVPRVQIARVYMHDRQQHLKNR